MSSPLNAFHEVVGQAHVLTQSDDMAPFTTDYRGLTKGTALAVLRPASTQEVAALVKICAAHNIAIIPQGGNTSYMGGAQSNNAESVIICLGRLNKIRNIDADNFTLTAEAGCTLHSLQQVASEANRFIGLQIASEGSAQLGGIIATNAGGILTLRFGNTRELVLGLEVVLPDGRIWNGLRSLRKDNTGYDLKQLFIGSEGSLGIVTAATIKLAPKPQQRETFLLALRTLDDAPALYASARAALGDALYAFELIPRAGIELAHAHGIACVDALPNSVEPWLILGEVAATIPDTSLMTRVENFVGAALNENKITDGVMASSEAQRAALWQMREILVSVQRDAGPPLKLDIAVPIARIPAFITQGIALLQQALPHIRPLIFGHFGDGNIHFNFLPPKGMAAADFIAHMPALEKTIHSFLVTEFNGSFAAEHGIGRYKSHELAQRKHGVEIDLMHAIKNALDPQHLMNPDSVLEKQQ